MEVRRRRVLFVVAGSLCVAVGVAFAVLAASWPGSHKPSGNDAQATSLMQPQTGTIDASTPPPPTGTTATSRPQASAGDPDAPRPNRTTTKTTKATAGPTTPGATPTSALATPETVEIAGVKAVVTGPVLIRNLSTGYCTDLNGYGAVASASRVTQWNCVGGEADNQEYEELKVAGGFLLRNVKSQLCLDIPGYDAAAAGGEVLTYECVPGDPDNQMFRIEADGAGSQIVNAKSKLCLDVSTENGAVGQPDQPLTLSGCGTTETQVWQLQ